MRCVVLLLFVSFLLVACQMADDVTTLPVQERIQTINAHSNTADHDSVLIYQNLAYEELFNGSLTKAEAYAYRSLLMSHDSTLTCDAMSLLCYIYYREGRQEKMNILMQMVSPDVYTNVMNVQQQVEQKKAGKQFHFYIVLILVLLLLLGGFGFWYVHRMKMLHSLYQQRITSVRQELKEELRQLSSTLSPTMTTITCSKLEIGETKTGIDVLFAIINDQNISQMGKHEEKALMKVLPVVDAALAAALGKAVSPLTPKETFFCVMEYYGKDDHQKALSFCCSEQAVRSTKSRLVKKMDLSAFRSE